MALIHSLPIILANTLLGFNRHTELGKSFFSIKIFYSKKVLMYSICAYLCASCKVIQALCFCLFKDKGNTVRISKHKGKLVETELNRKRATMYSAPSLLEKLPVCLFD